MVSDSKGPWFVSGVRFKMNGGEWHSVNRYNEALKRDENIACVGYDPRTGEGRADARLIASAPELLECLKDARRLLTDQDAIDLEYVDAVIAKAEGAVA